MLPYTKNTKSSHFIVVTRGSCLALKLEICFRPTYYLAEPVCVELSLPVLPVAECLRECAIILKLPGNRYTLAICSFAIEAAVQGQSIFFVCGSTLYF